ncbi:MAG TPA: hypothetical protein VE464_02465 [Streptosporangiaceae bacterium]|nr:hypothetical protein [Streptosporangiaceae bacterium]
MAAAARPAAPGALITQRWATKRQVIQWRANPAGPPKPRILQRRVTPVPAIPAAGPL